MQISVFDLDHTLLKVNSSFRFGLYLFHQKFMSLNTFTRCLILYFRHKYCHLSLSQLHQNVFALLFSGRSNDEINNHVQQFLTVHFDALVRNSVIQRLQHARERGDHLVILSNSPSFLVKPIARLLNVDHWMATQYFEDKDRNLQKISSFFEGEDKAHYIHLLAQRLNIPLTSFVMYSDSHLDLPALYIVGEAVGVAPDKELKKICIQKGWEVIYE